MLKGITFSAWDLLHPGHLFFLQGCKEYLDSISDDNQLIVGLHVNPAIERNYKNVPIQSVYERFTQLDHCCWIDNIIPYETERDLVNMLHTIKPYYYFLGSDYRNSLGEANVSHAVLDACQDRINIKFIDRFHDYSSSNLRERIKNA